MKNSTTSALSLSVLLASLGTSSANIALPALQRAFDAPFGDVQAVVVAYLLATTALAVGAGALGDRLGRRRVLIGGLALFALASVACALAPTLGMLVAARALQGLGAAAMAALAMSLAAGTGRAMGQLGAMSAVGTALGPVLGGVLVGAWGWRAIFLANAPLALAAVALAARRVPADLARASSRPVAVPRDPTLLGGCAAAALVAAVMMATLVAGPFHLTATLGLDAARAGLVMSIGPVVSALAGVPAGRAVDALGAARAQAAGLVAMSLAATMLAVLPGATGYGVSLGALAAGYQLFQAANNAAVLGAAAPAVRGAVAGWLNLARNVGLLAGAAALGALYGAAGFRITFMLAATLSLAALAIIRRGRRLALESLESAGSRSSTR